MAERLGNARKRQFINVSVLAALLATTRLMSGQTELVPIDNMTMSLIVTASAVHTDLSGVSLQFTLLNSGTKSVTGFELSIGPDVNIIQEFLAPTSKGFNPGGTFEKTVPLPRSFSTSDGLHATAGRSYFRVEAATFADGSAEGDSSKVANIKGIQRGRSTQLARMIPVLGGALDPDPVKQRQRLHTLKDRIQGLPDTTADGQEPSASEKSGMLDARESTVREIDELESNPNVNASQRLLAIKNDKEKMLISLTQQVDSNVH